MRVVVEPTRRSLGTAAQRIAEMSKKLDIRIEKSYLVINRVNGKLPPETGAFIEKLGIPLLGTISTDSQRSAFDATGKPLVDLPAESLVYLVVAGMMRKILT